MLICIPDISGFTKFMSEIDSELSSKMIPSLLNNIIYSNEIELRVSEIEGDAVLFYKELDLLKEKYTKEDNSHKIPKTLGLKIILHFGSDVDTVQIEKHIKLIGEDVIIAHKLLKNNIPKDEYLLLSENLLKQFDLTNLDNDIYWTSLKKGENVYEHLGEINYTYIDLEPLVKSK
ncbi:MAG: DUF2652 domain-containing protein [Flavobacteriaceae bacterium]